MAHGAVGTTRAHDKRPWVFSTQESEYFAQDLANACGLELRGTHRSCFGDGERYYRLDVSDREGIVGRDVVFVASTVSDADMLELYRVGCCAAMMGARRRIFVVPFLGYSTMERAVLPGEVVAAKANARMLSAIPNSMQGNSFLMMDLHVQGLLHYFEGDCIRRELYAERALIQGLDSLQLGIREEPGRFAFASADLGRPLWVETFARIYGTDLVFVQKSRRHEEVRVHNVIGNVTGKIVVIYDDMTRSAGTLIKAADAYVQQGASDVYAILSHFALNNEAVVDKLVASCIRCVVTTNSHPMSQVESVKRHPDRFKVMDVVPIFADTLKQSYFRVPHPGSNTGVRRS